MEERQGVIYAANVDEVPSLSTKPHEIATEVTAEEVVTMWAALKAHYEGAKALLELQKTQVSALAKTITKMQEDYAQIRLENDTLRGLLAKGLGPCVYCQLPAADIAKCERGFPGCARMDDLVNAINSPIEARLEALNLDLMEERDGLRAALAHVRSRVPAALQTPSIDEIILNRKTPHAWQPVPPEIGTDRTDEPCLLCINAKDHPIHDTLYDTIVTTLPS